MKKEEQIEIVAVAPGYKPIRILIKNTLETLQAIVCGYIELFYPWNDEVVIVCNEEGRIKGLPWNRAIYGDDGKLLDVIYGTFFIAGVSVDDDELHSLSEEQIEHYMNLFGGVDMNRWEEQRRRAERLKEQYKPGTRIECLSMDDPWSPVIPGTRGTVTSVDDAGTIHMKWDNGRTLGLIPGEDLFKVIKE